MTTIGESIKRERTKANISQSQLAGKLYVDRTTISKWENNKVQPKKEDLKKIADVLQISENNLADEKVLRPAASIRKDRKEVNNNIHIIFFSLLICGCALSPWGFLLSLISIIISTYCLPFHSLLVFL